MLPHRPVIRPLGREGEALSNDARLSPLFTWRSAVSSEDGPESSTTRHVLLALSLYMNQKGGSCFPSTRTLAKETALSRRTVEEHLRKAHREGWIDKSEPERGEDGTYDPAEYTATVPGESLSPGPGEADTEPGESKRSDQGKQVPHSTSVQKDAKGIRRGRTRPSRRHNGKPSGPGDPNYIGPCPDEGCEGQLKPTPKGPYCSVCAETKEAVA